VQLKRIGIYPARERASRARLFQALEEVFPVRFEAREDGDETGLTAAVLLPGANPAAGFGLPRLVAVSEEGPTLPPPPLGQRPLPAGPALDLLDGPSLDRRLRGARLREVGVAGAPPLVLDEGDVVLAAHGGDPLWAQRSAADGVSTLVAVAPAELEGTEALRDRVRDGRFLAVVALVQFLRGVCGELAWRAPELAACFLFDDPNLHWTSYGYLRYADLVREADRHRYHVAFATIPFDGWFAHPAAAELFRNRPDRLSLVVHGNNHEHMELARCTRAPQAHAMLKQALRRVASFERRSGVEVSRIMVPPHGVCSREIAQSLVPVGFEALCISRPYPWLARPPRQWLERPPESSPLAGWHPAAVIENGLPVLLRRGIGDPPEDLALRAFLEQPLIIQAHHQDVRDGLDRLAELAEVIRRLGDVQWKSLGDIAKSNVTTRRDGELLRVRMFTRRAELGIPDGVNTVAVETPSLTGGVSQDALELSASSNSEHRDQEVLVSPGSAELPLPAGTRAVRLRLISRDLAIDGALSRPVLPLRSTARRFATEARDRVAPTWRRISHRLPEQKAGAVRRR
jgi:hypothetical protein